MRVQMEREAKEAEEHERRRKEAVRLSRLLSCGCLLCFLG